MKKKPKFILVRLDVFDAQVLVAVGANIKEIEVFVDKQFLSKPGPAFYESLAQITDRSMGRAVYDSETGANVVWVRCVPNKPQHVAVLAHELLHVTYFLLDHMGVPINADNDEVVCYTMQHMLEKVLEAHARQ